MEILHQHEDQRGRVYFIPKEGAEHEPQGCGGCKLERLLYIGEEDIRQHLGRHPRSATEREAAIESIRDQRMELSQVKELLSEWSRD